MNLSLHVLDYRIIMNVI